MTHHLKKDEIEKNKNKNIKIAESRIKLGMILNEYGEKNNLKVSDDDVKAEIQKQIKGMPGCVRDRWVLEWEAVRVWINAGPMAVDCARVVRGVLRVPHGPRRRRAWMKPARVRYWE